MRVASVPGGGVAGGTLTLLRLAWRLAACLIVVSSPARVAGQATGYSTIYSFDASQSDGAYPRAVLFQAADGNFYGTTDVGGGASTYGLVFMITQAGSESVVHSFAGGPLDGAYPLAGVIQATDGSFYGTTSGGGASGDGTVFKIAPTGAETVLYSFAGGPSDGAFPASILVQSTDGNFYGTTETGGAAQAGTIFKVTPAGAETVLWSFAGGPSDGAYPLAGVTQATDGSFYGTTNSGGAYTYGTVFKITPAGAETVLYSFAGGPEDGAFPTSSLTQGADGKFYGTTYGGGADGDGTVFTITPAGAKAVIYSFTGAPLDGEHPEAGLGQAADGNFYGTTYYGGANCVGTIFSLTPAGLETVLHSFGASGSDGKFPVPGVIEATNGEVYGSTYYGGTNGQGTIYRLQIFVNGDFNGDGQPDLLFTNAYTGQLAVWFMNGLDATGGGYVSAAQAAGWRAVGLGDFNGDGHPDILFQNMSTGQLAVWFLDRLQVLHGAFISPLQNAQWQAVAVADFNGDGYPDILFQNAGTGQLAVWYMQGVTVIGGAYITPAQSKDWRVAGAADFNGDGQTDILFQSRSTGELAVWYMNGATVTGGAYVTPAHSTAWQALAVADYDGDGSPDIVFENTSTGRLAIWFMAGVNAVTGGYVSHAQNPSWVLAGPR